MAKLLKPTKTPTPPPPKRHRRRVRISIMMPCVADVTVQRDEGDDEWRVDTVNSIETNANPGVRAVTEHLNDVEWEHLYELADAGEDLP